MISLLIANMAQIIPLALFWALIYFGRHDLQPGTIALFILLWLGGLGFVLLIGYPLYAFAVIEAVLDIILVLMVFGGDMKILTSLTPSSETSTLLCN